MMLFETASHPMPSLHLATPGLRVRLERERLLVAAPAGEEGPAEQAVLLRDIERVFVGERTAVSLACLAEFLRRGVPVIILEAGGDILGFFERPAPLRIARRAQYRRVEDAAFCLAVATALVEAKILNQRRVLQRLAANREEAEITPHLLAMGRQAQEAVGARSLESLRGHEGTAAGRYFEIYGPFFPESAPFPRRTRRPPLDPPNAVLSYCYTLLAAECEALLHTYGLDPAIGCYHEAAENRPALALDLIEPFRAPLADALTLDLFSHGTLDPKTHFERRDGGCYLNTESKRRFFVAYDPRMEREFTSIHTSRRTSLRRELEEQVRGLREAFLSDAMFEPFRMN
ncbi:MAG: CRISPR-associated endonuclease Cas1 [Terrimicrobiaceae bacterium]|nr:CRISPR-associated endonuclease Cas1 [Terrimicrobiaceae bacterium]